MTTALCSNYILLNNRDDQNNENIEIHSIIHHPVRYEDSLWLHEAYEERHATAESGFLRFPPSFQGYVLQHGFICNMVSPERV